MYSLDFCGTDVASDTPYPDPIDLLQKWLPPLDSKRPVMALTTTGLDGYPNVRHVLASSVGPEGITFNTSAGSTKVAELRASPKAAIAIAWPNQLKQVVVQGDVVPQSKDQSAKVYAERPAYLRRLAHLNTDEFAQKPAAERRAAWASLATTPAEPPATWAGYVLVPRRISFWRGSEEVPSNRHDYFLIDGKWEAKVVAG